MLAIILKKTNEWFFSLRWRLVVTYFIIILLTLFLISIYILNSLQEYFFTQKNIELLTKANVIVNIASKYVGYNDEFILAAIKEVDIDKKIRIIITDKETKVQLDTTEVNNLKGKFFVKDGVITALKGKDDVKSTYEKDTGWSINAAVPILKDREPIGVVYLSTSAEDIMDFIGDIKQRLYLISFIVSLLIGVLSAVLAGVITGPVENLTNVIKHMADGRLNQKVEVRGKDEIAQLGVAFNKMSERLNRVEEKRSEFVSNASHELRTPLSSIKLLAESILQMPTVEVPIIQEFLTDINHEIDRLSRIIDRLLELTKMDVYDNELNLKNINLKELVRGIGKTISPLARRKNIKLEVASGRDLFVLIDEDKIWEAIFNLVDNSIKYTPAGGKVTIRIEKDDYKVRICVEDNGIGIPQEEVNKIFDRFYRVDKARARATGGTGLGLSIALSAVKLHEGDIEVESEEGKGSKFTIIIPYREK